MPSGRLHLRLERLTPRPTAAELEEVGKGLRMGHGEVFRPFPRSRPGPGVWVTAPQARRVLPQVLQVNSLIQTQKSAELAAALLSVYLERADELPVRAAPHAL